jgi:Fe2+ or Zn2+ uptake regulation protein
MSTEEAGMTPTELREKIIELASKRKAPVFSIVWVCQQIERHTWDSHHYLYRKVQFALHRMESDGLVGSTTFTNNDTAWWLWSRVVPAIKSEVAEK